MTVNVVLQCSKIPEAKYQFMPIHIHGSSVTGTGHSRARSWEGWGKKDTQYFPKHLPTSPDCSPIINW